VNPVRGWARRRRSALRSRARRCRDRPMTALLHPLCIRHDVLDLAGHEEGLLGEMVVLALEDLAEAADGFLELDVRAGAAGELLRHEERLGHEGPGRGRP